MLGEGFYHNGYPLKIVRPKRHTAAMTRYQCAVYPNPGWGYRSLLPQRTCASVPIGLLEKSMRSIVATGLILAASSVQAACPVETFLSCRVEGGKQIEVCIQPGNFIGDGSFTYTFGTTAAPELSLSVPMSAGTVIPWSGVGRAIWAAVRFPNVGYDYEVWHSFDRLDPEAELRAGVNVWHGEEMVADHTCTGGEIGPVFTLEDSMAAAGYCWNREGFHWQRDDCG